ncbi:MAG: hypothetical protein R2772_04310 [Chitinophagales bacterium]
MTKKTLVRRNYMPWVIAAVIIIAISYYGPISNAIENNVKASANSFTWHPNTIRT